MSSPASAAPLPQRLSAKEWNVRLAANEELITLLNEANEGNVVEFSRYGKEYFMHKIHSNFTFFVVPFLKKIVVDPYPPVKEKAMDVLLIFMSKFNYQSVVPPKYVPTFITNIAYLHVYKILFIYSFAHSKFISYELKNYNSSLCI